MNKKKFQNKINEIIESFKNNQFDKVEKLSLNLTKDFPDESFGWKSLGILYKRKGQLDKSLDVYKIALKKNPLDAETHYNLGNIYRQINNLSEAEFNYQNAIKIFPNYIEAFNNLAITYKDLDKIDKAINIYKKLLKLKPNYAEGYNNLGTILKDQNRFNDALNYFKKAIILKPNYPEAYCNLGIVYRSLGNLDESTICFNKSIEINSNYVEPYYNLGINFREKGKLDDAINFYNKVIQMKPDYAHAYCSKGIALRVKGNLEESENCHNKAIKLKQNYAEAYDALSSTLLLKGDYEKAFKLSEWRWSTKQNIGEKLITSKPFWTNKNDHVVFVWKEQGVGDEILYCSMINELAEKSKKVILNCDKRLISLFKRSFHKNIIFESNRKLINENDYDSHLSMGSLPFFFRKNKNNFKNSSNGYLKADNAKTLNIKKKLKNNPSTKLIGISWGSKSTRSMSSFRNIDLKDLTIQLNSNNIKFVSLQYGDVTKEIEYVRKNYNIDITEVSEIDKFNDLDGLTSLISACDFVVTIENLVAHLSGSLGIDTKLLLSIGSNPNWGCKVKNSFWYDSVNIYRQSEVGDWKTVLKELKKDI